MIASGVAVSQEGNSLTFQTDTGIRLRARLQLILDLSVYRLNSQRITQSRLNEADRNGGVKGSYPDA